jgi:hypothetical protein
MSKITLNNSGNSGNTGSVSSSGGSGNVQGGRGSDNVGNSANAGAGGNSANAGGNPVNEGRSPNSEQSSNSANQTTNGKQAAKKAAPGDKSTEDKAPDAQDSVKQRKVLLEWESPMRHFKKMDRKKFFLILFGVMAFFVVLVILQQYWLMLAIAAVMFMVYAWGTVPPAELHHVITNKGIESAGSDVEWENLTEYWYTKKDDQYILNVKTNVRLPGKFIMLVNEDQLWKTHEILSNRLKYKDMRKQDKLSKVLDGVWVDLLKQDSSQEMSSNQQVAGNGQEETN